mmetsp:Transcript_18569/g.23907  ORF Transcript_18569/g.23907 Transcript_18569/m.23907 type:complete len:132 (-) Transcript_18569:114-509(-)
MFGLRRLCTQGEARRRGFFLMARQGASDFSSKASFSTLSASPDTLVKGYPTPSLLVGNSWNTNEAHTSSAQSSLFWLASAPWILSTVVSSLSEAMGEAVWNMSSTLKKRRAKMNKHKLKKRRKKLSRKTKK